MTKMRLLAREALAVTKDRAPAIVSERILPTVFDEISDYVGEIMGKLTNLPPENETAITMAHGIVRDRLITEIIDQLKNDMHDDLGKRLKKWKKLSTEKK